jgi:hypothetical protein
VTHRALSRYDVSNCRRLFIEKDVSRKREKTKQSSVARFRAPITQAGAPGYAGTATGRRPKRNCAKGLAAPRLLQIYLNKAAEAQERLTYGKEGGGRRAKRWRCLKRKRPVSEVFRRSTEASYPPY